MPLLSCECLSGKPIGEQLVAIYCALLEIVNNGGGGTVNINDVEGVSDFWKAALGETPAANKILATDGSGVFTTFDAGSNELLGIAVPAEDVFLGMTSAGSINTLTPTFAAEFIALGDVGVSATQNPVTSITTVNGIVTALS